jgi:hypothetical protein
MDERPVVKRCGHGELRRGARAEVPMLKLERGRRPRAGGPGLAAAGAGDQVLIGVACSAAGQGPGRGLQAFFWEPVKSGYALGELMVKATPLLLIALGWRCAFAPMSGTSAPRASS